MGIQRRRKLILVCVRKKLGRNKEFDVQFEELLEMGWGDEGRGVLGRKKRKAFRLEIYENSVLDLVIKYKMANIFQVDLILLFLLGNVQGLLLFFFFKESSYELVSIVSLFGQQLVKCKRVNERVFILVFIYLYFVLFFDLFKIFYFGELY